MDWPSDGTANGDFGVSSDGDLLVADGDTEVRQRVTRRLLSNNRSTAADGSILFCDLIFDPSYGVGLRRFVGAASNSPTAEAIKNSCKAGVIAEDTVSSNPPPQVVVQAFPGALAVQVTYTSAISGRTIATPRITLGS